MPTKKKSPTKVTNKAASKLLTKKLYVKKKNLINHIALLLDESGSMSSIQDEALQALNQQLAVIRSQAQTENQDTTVSILKFNTTVSILDNAKPVDEVRDLEHFSYMPTGQTALMDAVGQAIIGLQSIPVNLKQDVSYLLVVVTDGEENASRNFDSLSISNLIATKQKSDRWSFVFSVPRYAATTIQRFLNVPIGNIQEWDATFEGIRTLSASISQGMKGFYSARSSGQTSTKNYFTTDLSNVDPADIKSLNVLNSQFKKLKVLKEVEIRPFVEKEGLSFEKGRGFYELTKPEEVQDYKEIVIMDKSTGKLYGGNDARKILGMPTTGTTRVRPGNHMNYAIFVKSTSVNRKLVRGTTLLYLVK